MGTANPKERTNHGKAALRGGTTMERAGVAAAHAVDTGVAEAMPAVGDRGGVPTLTARARRNTPNVREKTTRSITRAPRR